jgi:hypothetical protein
MFGGVIWEGGGGQAQPKLHLTYKGLVRLLNRSNKPMARQFCSWASQVIYAAHMGTPKQRCQLAADVMGYPVQAVQDFMRSCCACKLHVVYLTGLGALGKVRDSLRIASGDDDLPDDAIVCKVGLSDT